MANHQDRLRALESIEQDISTALQSAASTVGELGKDTKFSVRASEQHTMTFMKTVNNIESNLLKQIHYLSEVSTGYPHTSSSYSALKDYQMAVQRSEHIASRLSELEQLKLDHQSSQRQGKLRRQLSQQPSMVSLAAGPITNNLT